MTIRTKVEMAVLALLVGVGAIAEIQAAQSRERIQMIFQEQSNGDYRLSVYGGRRMVCEEKDVVIVHQPDAVEPLVIECKHGPRPQ